MSKYHSQSIMHFKSITLLILDMKRSLAFYIDILGLKVLESKPHQVKLSADGIHVLIQLIEDRAALPLGISLGLYHYALLVPNYAALASVIKRLAHQKYPISGASDHGVSDAIYLDDPDGNGIEIYVDKDDDAWPMDHGKLTMWTKGMDLTFVMQHQKDDDQQAIHSDTILGHLHFHVQNLDSATQFYSNVIGFKVMLDYGKSARFVSDGGYHHHLGLNTWQGDAPLTKEKQVGLKSYVLHISGEHYMAFLRRLQEYHVPLIAEDNYKYIIDPLNQKIILDVS
jgi:catechol 2,3-dioxygenase